IGPRSHRMAILRLPSNRPIATSWRVDFAPWQSRGTAAAYLVGNSAVKVCSLGQSLAG
ncbi:hypothetical protein NDU88_005018, partial [Pleurodeles waltl]